VEIEYDEGTEWKLNEKIVLRITYYVLRITGYVIAVPQNPLSLRERVRVRETG